MEDQADVPVDVPGEASKVAIGDVVMYHHKDDDVDYPAMVLVLGGDDDLEENVVLLQIFRPRANNWLWVSEGEKPGQYTL